MAKEDQLNKKLEMIIAPPPGWTNSIGFKVLLFVFILLSLSFFIKIPNKYMFTAVYTNQMITSDSLKEPDHYFLESKTKDQGKSNMGYIKSFVPTGYVQDDVIFKGEIFDFQFYKDGKDYIVPIITKEIIESKNFGKLVFFQVLENEKLLQIGLKGNVLKKEQNQTLAQFLLKKIRNESIRN